MTACTHHIQGPAHDGILKHSNRGRRSSAPSATPPFLVLTVRCSCSGAMEIQLSFEEQIDFSLLTEHQPVEFVCGAPPDAQLSLALDGQPLEPFMRPGEAAWRWRWNPGSAVGIHRAELIVAWPDGSAARRAWSLRVATRKI